MADGFPAISPKDLGLHSGLNITGVTGGAFAGRRRLLGQNRVRAAELAASRSWVQKRAVPKRAVQKRAVHGLLSWKWSKLLEQTLEVNLRGVTLKRETFRALKVNPVYENDCSSFFESAKSAPQHWSPKKPK